MNWGQVKKINSDLSTPLDVQQMLFNISMFGDAALENYDMDIISSLVRSKQFYLNKVALSIVSHSLFDYIINLGNDVGTVLNNAFGLGVASAVDCHTWDDCLSNTELMSSLSTREGFFIMQKYIPSEMLPIIYGNSGAVLSGSRQCLFKVMYEDSDFSSGMVDILRENAFPTLVSNAEQFLARQSHEYTADEDKYVLYVAIGAGGNGCAGGRSGTSMPYSGSGGDCGVYIQDIIIMNKGDVFDATIAADSTKSTYANVDLGRGGGEAKGGAGRNDSNSSSGDYRGNNGGTPSQAGKIIKVSAGGNGGNYTTTQFATAFGGNGGAGGYGGGNGINSSNATGGVGASVLNLVEGTAGDDTTAGGGGNKAPEHASSANPGGYGGAGGGGYGGGGGGAGSTNSSANLQGGNGGSGGIIIFH